jgi:hypothetical protein
MQFLPDGPHVPDELIQSLEDDKVVLFCGAGVSKNVGLPDFGELVKKVYRNLHLPVRKNGEPDNEEECDEFGAKNFDRVLGLLEARLGNRTVVRRAVQEILKIPPGASLPFHRSLLELARTPEGAYRLVTTNFDAGFVIAGQDPFPCDVAPMLPPPRADQWKRLAHLHGLIEADGRSLEDLILTSADFGDAYIRSGWASRFVTELFSNFSVIFIGYSVNDPVMRYLVDAMAVESVKRPRAHSVYSFVPSDVPDEGTHRAKWKAKGIEAILYRWDETHNLLVGTIKAWADLHKGGQVGRLGVVSKYANIQPSKPYEQDHRVSQMIWALRDPTSQAARKFATSSPPPPVEWLEPLEASGLMSLAGPPSPLGTWCSFNISQFDPAAKFLHAWLLEHLDKPEVIERVIASNGVLDPTFRANLRYRLEQASGNLPEPYRAFWMLVSSGVAVPLLIEDRYAVFDLPGMLKGGNSDPLLRHAVLDQLRPRIELSRAVMHLFRDNPDDPPERVAHLAEVNVVLRCGSEAPELVMAIRTAPHSGFLLSIVWELTGFLRLAMDLYSAAGLASEDYDPSVYQQQSLGDDPPHLVRTWTALIALLREALESAIVASERKLANALIECWLHTPYPIFRSLALFGISKSGEAAAAGYLQTLLADDKRLLWPYYTREFAPRVVADACKGLTAAEFEHVVAKLSSGPPRSMFKGDISEEDYLRLSNLAVFAMLDAIESTGATLPEPGKSALKKIRTAWDLEKERQSDSDLARFAGDGFERRAEEAHEFERRSDQDVFDWVVAGIYDAEASYLLEAWALKNPLRITALLKKLADAGLWEEQFWRPILSGGASASSKMTGIAEILAQAPDATLVAIAPELARWFSYTSQRSTQITQDFLDLWDLVCPLVRGSGPLEEHEDPLVRAMNSPVGQLCKALLEAFFASSPKLGSGLPTSISTRIVRLLDAPENVQPAHMILSTFLYGLHVVDRDWTRKTLLPLFEWRTSFAASAWQCYLHNARWYPDLISDFKLSFIEALGHREELGDVGRYLCGLLANVEVYSASSLTEDELTSALQQLGRRGMVEFTDALVRVVKGTDEAKRADLWSATIKRLIGRPLDQDKRSPELTDRMVDLALALGDLFNEAAATVQLFLTPVSSPGFGSVVHRIAETGIPERHPLSVLKVVAAVMPATHDHPFMGAKAIDLLKRICATKPELRESPEYRRVASSGWFELG